MRNASFKSIVALLLLMLVTNGCSSDLHEPTGYEVLPDGLPLTYSAKTLPELKRRLKPQVAWEDQYNNSSVFLWCREKNGKPVFILDCAYPLLVQGHKRWGILNTHADDDTAFEHPVRQFMQLRFVRREMRLDDQHSDAFRGSVSLVSKGPGGAQIYKVVYSSQSGHRGQKDTAGFLVLVEKDRDVRLVAKDLHEYGDKSGWIGKNDSVDIKVEWGTSRQAGDFTVSLIERTDYYPGVDGSELSGLTFFQVGRLTGEFPMRKVMESKIYMMSDGKMTLHEIAATMSAYFSDWLSSDWVTARQKELPGKLWHDELQRLNPHLSLTEVIPEGQLFFVPDGDVYGRHIFDQVKKLEPKRVSQARPE